MSRPLVIFGLGALARSTYATIRADRAHRVAGFTVDAAYRSDDRFDGLPVVAFDEIDAHFPAADHDLLLLIGYRRMRDRRRLFERAKAKGYSMPNLIAPTARIEPGVVLGENNLIGDLCYVGFEVTLGDNVVIRPMTHIGHGTRIESHAFIAPGVKLAGGCRIGAMSYLGIGAVVIDRVTLGAETLVAAGAVIVGDTPACSQFAGNPARQVGEHGGTGILILR
jgi:sugar O-acyltransferase (sialic acid O-acetyltransferase NeuD family)